MANIREINKDLFAVRVRDFENYNPDSGDSLYDFNDIFYAHCISADFALGAGIAKEFDKHFSVRRRLISDFYPFYSTEYWINHAAYNYDRGYVLQTKNVFNLVTKCYYNNKPTNATLMNALKKLREICELQSIYRLVMPRIGCGLDRLNWNTVRNIIGAEFSSLENIEIIICNYQKEIDENVRSR